MAFRLGPHVVYGELRNTSHYATHGVLVLQGEAPGEETVVHIDLTGDCEPDLRGKGFRFWPDENGPAPKCFARTSSKDSRPIKWGRPVR